ncbi:MAG: sterol desaturase family protein [Deltaproteobacteria bacterium]|nr:sterol desaturase family protein [Deltaproteobacteria bacterium]
MNTGDKSDRLFQSDFWERLTHVHHNTPLFIYGPAIVAAFFYGLFGEDLNVGAAVGFYLFGAFSWTFTEYGLHRFVFHYEPTSYVGKRLHYLFHGIHHDFPNQATRLVMPPTTSIPISIVLFGIFYLAMGGSAYPFYAGFISGYLYYEFVHFSIHHTRKAGLLWNESQRKQHLQHHFKNADKQYGVTSPLWDIIFRTIR